MIYQSKHISGLAVGMLLTDSIPGIVNEAVMISYVAIILPPLDR